MSETQLIATLTCPKCGGAMRAYERSGVIIDQCAECRGIYLDRGELDRIVDAEGARAPVSAAVDADDRWPSSGVQAAGGSRRARDGDDHAKRRSDDDDDEDRDRDYDYGRQSDPRDGANRAAGSQPRKKGGLFGNVMDIFGGE
jgi:Zn-finger nucleic acid-binding protein